MKQLLSYKNSIKKMIKARKGGYDSFLDLQVENAACAMMLRDKIMSELAGKDLTSIEVGSMGQQKVVENPLNQRLQKQLVIVNDSLEACGINFNSTPSKMRNSELSDADGLAELKTLMTKMQ